MSVSSTVSDNSKGKAFVATANAAMLRAARQVAAENKRLGLPLIVEKPKPAANAGKRRHESDR